MSERDNRTSEQQADAVKPEDNELSSEELESAAGGALDNNGTCPINHNYVAGCGGGGE